MLGSLSRNASGNISDNVHVDTPTGLLMSRTAYSTTRPRLFLQSSRPMVGPSPSVQMISFVGGQVEVELAGELRLEVDRLQLHDRVAM